MHLDEPGLLLIMKMTYSISTTVAFIACTPSPY